MTLLAFHKHTVYGLYKWMREITYLITYSGKYHLNWKSEIIINLAFNMDVLLWLHDDLIIWITFENPSWKCTILNRESKCTMDRIKFDVDFIKNHLNLIEKYKSHKHLNQLKSYLFHIIFHRPYDLVCLAVCLVPNNKSWHAKVLTSSNYYITRMMPVLCAFTKFRAIFYDLFYWRKKLFILKINHWNCISSRCNFQRLWTLWWVFRI